LREKALGNRKEVFGMAGVPLEYATEVYGGSAVVRVSVESGAAGRSRAAEDRCCQGPAFRPG
jgi:hypothetical protein